MENTENTTPPQSAGVPGSADSQWWDFCRNTADEILAHLAEGEPTDYRRFTPKRDRIIKILLDRSTPIHVSCNQRERALRDKLMEWIQPCFCAGRSAKCLMCETRELLGQNKD